MKKIHLDSLLEEMLSKEVAQSVDKVELKPHVHVNGPAKIVHVNAVVVIAVLSVLGTVGVVLIWVGKN